MPNRLQTTLVDAMTAARDAIAYAARAALLAFAALSVLALLSLLSGCAKSGNDPGSTRVVPRGSIESCKPQVSSGDPAIMANALRDDVRTAPYFEKKYDRADLDAVAEASVAGTVDYVRALGIALYRVPQTTSKKPAAGAVDCPSYSSLKIAPGEAMEVWKRALNGDLGGKLVGQYFDLCGTQCSDTRVLRPTILIDEAADRWTLIHEMLHHDFNLQRKATPGTPSTPKLIGAVAQDLDEIERLQNAYLNQQRLSNLLNLAKALDTATRTKVELLIRSAFEEIATEALLVDAYVDGSLTNVTDQAAITALLYMEHARMKGLESLHDLDDHLDFVEAEAKAYLWPLVSAQTLSTRALIKSYESQTSYYVAMAKSGVAGMKKNGVKALDEDSPELGIRPGLASPRLAESGVSERLQSHDDHLESLEGAEALRLFKERIRELREELH